MDLTAMAEAVQTEAGFLQFATALLADWEDEQAQLRAHPDLQAQLQWGPGPNGWENGSIGGFLSAMIRWAEDSDHSKRYSARPDWNLFAFMLLAWLNGTLSCCSTLRNEKGKLTLKIFFAIIGTVLGVSGMLFMILVLIATAIQGRL